MYSIYSKYALYIVKRLLILAFFFFIYTSFTTDSNASTKFYLPSTGTPDISPGADASWEKTSDLIRLSMVRTKIGSTQLIQSGTSSSLTGSYDVLLAQFISEPISAQSISGTVSGVIKARETNAAADLRTQVLIKVVSNDGTVERGTLLAHDGGVLASEWNTSATLMSRYIPVALRANTLSNVNAQDGDRIVIEIGYRRHTTVDSTTYTGRLYFEDAGTDLPFSDTDTSVGDPWIEFSHDFFPMATHTVEQGNWRWYSDTSPDTSMNPLASENSSFVLNGTQIQNGNIRLRAQITETGGVAGSGDISLQYGVDGTNWNTLPNQSGGTTNQPNYWFRYANGTATSGDMITTQKLTGTNESGLYYETPSVPATIGASSIHEIDLALQVRWPTPNETVKFRILYNGVPITGGTEMTLVTSSVSDRPYTIDKHTVGGNTSSDMGRTPWTRQFYDGTRWWFFAKHDDQPNNLVYYYWDGPGNNWSSAFTLNMGASGTDGRHSVAMAEIGGETHFYVHWGSSNSTRRFARGIVSGTTISWGSVQTLAQPARSHHHIAVDDGGYIWVGGVRDNAGTPENLWIRRSTNVDSVSSWEPEIVVTDPSITAGKVTAIMGLSSNKALIIWHSVNALKYAMVDSGGIIGSGIIADPARREDWGMARSNGYVYLVHTNLNDDTGDWVLEAFNELTNTWSTGPTWVKPVEAIPSTDDGLGVVAVGNEIYVVGTFEGNWASDRVLYWQKYSGPGASGSWADDIVALSPAGRGNGDRISVPLSVGDGLLLYTWDFADDDMVGSANTIEYHYLNVLDPNFTTSSHVGVDINGENLEPGDTIRYSINLTNSGLINASGVKIEEIINSNLENISNVTVGAFSTNCGLSYTNSSTSNIVDITGLQVNAGSTCTITYDVVVKNNTPINTSINQTASIITTLGGAGSNAISNTLTVLNNPHLIVTKTENDSDNFVQPGQIITYTLTIKNEEIGNVTGIDLEDHINGPLSYISNITLSNCGGAYTNMSSGLNINILNLSISSSQICTITYKATVSSSAVSGSIQNTADFTQADEGGNNPAAVNSSLITIKVNDSESNGGNSDEGNGNDNGGIVTNPPKTGEEPTDPDFEEKPKTIDVIIIVNDQYGKPIQGAKVTLQSDTYIEYTDRDGIAKFKSIPVGDHRVTIEYKGKTVSSPLSVVKGIQRYNIELNLILDSPVNNKQSNNSNFTYVIIGLLILIIVMTTVILINYYRVGRVKQDHTQRFY